MINVSLQVWDEVTETVFELAVVSTVAAGLQTEIPRLTSGMSSGLRNKVEAAIAELGALGVEPEQLVSDLTCLFYRHETCCWGCT